MIELPVTLTSTGGAVSFASPVPLGYTKNKGVYRLLVTAEGEWEGLTIRCFWHLPGGSDPASSIVQDGAVDVPASVTAHPGNGCITFEGSDGEKTVTSADLRYRVGSNSGTEDGTMPEPGTPAWEQLVSETAVALEAVQKQIGNLDDLTTKAKETLVAAINEAARTGSGGAGSMDLRVAEGYVQYSTDSGVTWTNLIAVAELKGADGKSAYQHAQEGGYTGTETEFAAKLAQEIPPVDSTLTNAGQAADAKATGDAIRSLSEEIVATSESKVAAHNTGTDTHSDIRLLIQGLTDRINALADSDDTTLDQLSEVVAYIKSNRGLIEAITTSKVSVADIVDNLTTNVANKPLSAAQGVALKALIDAITIPEALPNPNALTFTGAVTGSYDGSAPLTVNIPEGGGGAVGGSGWSSEWKVLADTTLSEDVVNVHFDFDRPVQEILIKANIGGDGTNRAITLFGTSSVGYGKNLVTFDNVLRTDAAVSAWLAIYAQAFKNFAFFRCQYYLYNRSVGQNTPMFNASELNFTDQTRGNFIGENFPCINIGCWKAGTYGVIKAGTRIEILGR